MGRDSPLKDWLSFKPVGRWTIVLAVAGSLAVAGIGVSQFSEISERFKPKQQVLPQVVNTPTKEIVTALGRLEPQGEIIKLSSSSSFEGSLLSKLEVKQGDRVEQGQLVAILDNYGQKMAILEQAKKQVQVAQANLAKVRAGAKVGEINAQKAEIDRLEAQLSGEVVTQRATIARLQAQLIGERKTQQATIARLQAQLIGETKAQQATIARLQAQVRNAETEFERYRILYQQGAIQASIYDSKRLELDTAREQLNEARSNLGKIEETLREQINEARATRSQTEETLQQQINEAKAIRSQTIDTLQQQIKQAKARLEEISEVRPTDLQASQAEVENALATVRKAQADLDLAYVRSPVAGQVLKINARPGERIGDDGILELGQTDLMYVVAEVYQTEIDKVRIGQPVTIKSSAFAGELKGAVDQLGLKIGKKNILNDDPAAEQDARVVEVKVRLTPEDSKRVAGLSNLQVEVAIEVSAPTANETDNLPDNSTQTSP